LGHRPLVSKSPLKYADHYVWQTYAEVDERRRNLGSAVHTLFENGTVGGGEYHTVGLWSPNRPGGCLTCWVTQSITYRTLILEWVIIELALNVYGKVGVSLYDTLGNEAVGTLVHDERQPLELILMFLRVYVRTLKH
jgi:long-chain acyl-CoA synthetase